MSGIIDCEMHIGDEVFVHGYIDEIRNDTIIIRNVGGYFGTSRDEVFYYEEDERGYGAMNEADRKTEPKTQTKTQNSNLTFEKDECAKEYEELGLKELKELIEADRKTESNSEKPNNCEDEPTISKMEQVDEPYIDIETGILHWCGWKYRRIYEDEPQTNPCNGCVCDDGKHLMYCMNCKGIAWKTEPPKVEDEPQTELVRVKYHCINCAENGSYKCSKCDGEMYYKYDKDEPQTDKGIGCSRCEGRFECYDRDMPHAVHCNNYGKVTDEPQTDCAWMKGE